MVRPSGETSSEIQVPSEVVNSTARSGLRGSESLLFLIESAAVPEGCWPRRGSGKQSVAATTTTATVRRVHIMEPAKLEASRNDVKETGRRARVDKSGPRGDYQHERYEPETVPRTWAAAPVLGVFLGAFVTGGEA
jgi:hypothetical protein